MTDHTDRPAPGTPMTDHAPTPTQTASALLARLVQMPPDQVGTLRNISLTSGPDPYLPQPHLQISTATRQAAQDMADRLGLTGPPTTKKSPGFGTLITQWDGTWGPRTVEIYHLDMPRKADYDTTVRESAGRALTVHLARLVQAMELDEARDIREASLNVGGLNIRATSTPAARALAHALCPDTTGTTHTLETDDRWTYWEAHSEDTTIGGPTTDTAADDHTYC